MSPRSRFRLPQRLGYRPKSGPPPYHLQLDQQSPRDILDVLGQWMFGDLPREVVVVREKGSKISTRGTRALWLDESVDPPHADAFMPPDGSREFAHLHPDGSLHVCLPTHITKVVLLRGWGEPHPWQTRGMTATLIYAPRSLEEIDVVRQVVLQAVAYAGATPPATPSRTSQSGQRATRRR